MSNHEITIDTENLNGRKNSVSVRPYYRQDGSAVVELNTTDNGEYSTFFLKLEDAKELAQLVFGAVLRAEKRASMNTPLISSERLSPM